jgi:ectoine hydroxylase-related dioxygenase (phytanoyl-CoA dioxygenase family)
MNDMVRRIEDEGFATICGPLAGEALAVLATAYDRHFKTSRVRDGSTSLRTDSLVNAGPPFDGVYVHPPLLAAARALIGPSFKLSAYHARTLKPNAAAQGMHRDFEPLADGWPMVGFILMIDGFTEDNGATRMVPRSQSQSRLSPNAQSVAACGPAGTMLIYNGSIWHGHGTNLTPMPRRSIQGALIRSDQKSAVDHARETQPDTAVRLSTTARTLLGLSP